MNDTAPVNAYLRTKVLTASPEELRLLLLDGAIRFASQARQGMLDKNDEARYAGFTGCRGIVFELLTTIRPEHDPALADRVRALYSFMYTELLAANTDRDVDRLDKVIALLEYERETWVMLMDQLSRERRGEAPAHDPGEQRSPLSLQA